MSSYTETSARSVSRPTTLTAAIGAAIVVAIGAIGNGIVILAGGLDLVKGLANQVIAKELGISEDEVTGLGDLGLEDSDFSTTQQLLQNRAYAVLVCGVLVLLFGLLMRKAAMWARILVTLTALGAAGFSLIIVTDVANGLMMALGYAAIIGAPVAIVLAFLPANHRYAKTVR